MGLPCAMRQVWLRQVHNVLHHKVCALKARGKPDTVSDSVGASWDTQGTPGLLHVRSDLWAVTWRIRLGDPWTTVSLLFPCYKSRW